MGINYKENNQWKEVKVKVGDNIPVGAEMDYDGSTIPVGYEEVTNPDSYSTSEIKTNKTWKNGKPIYRKVVDNTTASAVNGESITVIATNVDEIVHLEGFIYGASAIILLNMDGYSLTYTDKNNDNFRTRTIIYNSSYTSKPVTYIVEYTKTTD